MKKIIFLLALLIGIELNAQLPDGSTAPDFTLIDVVDSNSYTLYDYLNAGKTVFVEVFAAHCGTCWNYHNTNRMKNMYNMYGPDGTDEIMIFALEYDQWNHWDAFIGNGPAWVTQGNWIDGTPYPIFNVEDPDRTIFTDYQVPYYPLVYKICPDKKTEWISTQLDETALYQKVQDCATQLSVDQEVLEGRVYIDQLNKNLVIDQYEFVQSLDVFNLQGQKIFGLGSVTSGTISIDNLKTGIYLFQIRTDKGLTVKKLYLN